MRLTTLSRLLALAVFLCPLTASAQVQRQAAETASTSAAGWAVLEHTPRLSAPADTALELKRILAQDEYQGRHAPPPRQSWFSRMWERLQQLLGAGTGLTGAWGAVLAVLLLALLAFLVVRLLWRWAARGSRRTTATAGRQVQQQTAEQLLAAAELAAGQNDFRAAIRYRYLALLRVLNLVTAALMTNSQIKRRVSRRYPALQGSLGQLVTAYEDSWYGGIAARREDYELANNMARAIEQVYAERSVDERASE